MPHGESWFSFLPFYESLAHWLSVTFGPSYLEHNSHLSAQYVLAYAVVILGLILVALMVSRRLKNPEDHILPEGKVSFYGFIETIVGVTAYGYSWSDTTGYLLMSAAWCVVIFAAGWFILRRRVEAL